MTAVDLIGSLYDGTPPAALARHAAKYDRLGLMWRELANPKLQASLLAASVRAGLVDPDVLEDALSELAASCGDAVIPLDFEAGVQIVVDTIGRDAVAQRLGAIALFEDEPEDVDPDSYVEIEVSDAEIRARWKPETPPALMGVLDADRVGRLAGLPPDELDALRLAEDLGIVATWDPSQAVFGLTVMAIGAGRVGGDPARFLAGAALVEETGGCPTLLEQDREWTVWKMSAELRGGLMAFGRAHREQGEARAREARERVAAARRDAEEQRRIEREARDHEAALEAEQRQLAAAQSQREREERERLEAGAQARREAEQALVDAGQARRDEDDRIRAQAAEAAALAEAGRARASRLRELAGG